MHGRNSVITWIRAEAFFKKKVALLFYFVYLSIFLFVLFLSVFCLLSFLSFMNSNSIVLDTHLLYIQLCV